MPKYIPIHQPFGTFAEQSSTTLAQVTLPTNMEDAEKLEEFLNGN